MASNKPILVGITGGIGSGKSTICKVFNHLGVPSYDSDSRARTLMVSHTSLIAQLKAAFGDDLYVDGQLQRQKLAAKVFQDEAQLQQLNALVHPAVAKDFEKWVDSNSDQKVLIKEAALLIETNSYQTLDELIVVMAPEALKIKRVLQRDPHRTEQDVKNIMENQMIDAERAFHASYTIINDGQTMVLPQVLEIFEELVVN